MSDTSLGQSDDLRFIAEAKEQVQAIYDAYRAGKLPLSSDVMTALSQTREQLVAIRLDGSANPSAADQRIAACVQIVQMLREARPGPDVPAPAASIRSAPTSEPSTPPETKATAPAMSYDRITRDSPVGFDSTRLAPPSFDYPAQTGVAPLQPPNSWSGYPGPTWAPPGVPNPATPDYRRPKLRVRNVIVGLICAIALLFVVPAVAIPLVFGKSHTHAIAGQTISSAPSGQAVPALDSLLSTPPADGLVIDSRSSFNGYLNQSQTQQVIGTTLPPGTQMYASTWVGSNGIAIIEVAVLTPSPSEAVEFAEGFYSSVAKTGHSFAIPGLEGAAGGATISPTGNEKPKALASVARSRVALFFIAAATDTNRAQTLATEAAKTAGESLPVDPGSL